MSLTPRRVLALGIAVLLIGSAVAWGLHLWQKSKKLLNKTTATQWGSPPGEKGTPSQAVSREDFEKTLSQIERTRQLNQSVPPAVGPGDPTADLRNTLRTIQEIQNINRMNQANQTPPKKQPTPPAAPR